MSTLKRYTELPYALHALRERSITLVSPKSWDDKNDAHHLEWYRRRKELKSVLALCLTEAPQTYHHWRIFTQGSSGVAIYFHKVALEKWAVKSSSIAGSKVKYRTLEDVREKPPRLAELPYLKRYAYRDEKEYRLIHEDSKAASRFKNFPFDLRMIERIVLSPWLPRKVAETVTEEINDIEGCGDIPISHASIVENDEWQEIGRDAEV